MKKILMLLLISTSIYGQNSAKVTKEETDISQNSLIKGSFLGGEYPSISSEFKAIKEIGNAMINYKFLHKNNTMAPHTNPTDVFVTVIFGKVLVRVQGEDNILESGDFICIPAKAIHELICIKDVKLLIIK